MRVSEIEAVFSPQESCKLLLSLHLPFFSLCSSASPFTWQPFLTLCQDSSALVPALLLSSSHIENLAEFNLWLVPQESDVQLSSVS